MRDRELSFVGQSRNLTKKKNELAFLYLAHNNARKEGFLTEDRTFLSLPAKEINKYMTVPMIKKSPNLFELGRQRFDTHRVFHQDCIFLTLHETDVSI